MLQALLENRVSAVQTTRTSIMRPVEVRNGYFKAHCLVAELDASVLQHASGRQPQAWTKATQLCKQAEQTGSARANYYRKGSKSDNSGCLQRRGTAAGVQARLPRRGAEQQ